MTWITYLSEKRYLLLNLRVFNTNADKIDYVAGFVYKIN